MSCSSCLNERESSDVDWFALVITLVLILTTSLALAGLLLYLMDRGWIR